MEANNNFVIYNNNCVEKVDEKAYKNWLIYNWSNYNTGLENVQCMNDKVSTGFIAHIANDTTNKPFAVLYYRGGNINGKHVIKEYYASWEEALKRHLQLIECGYSSLKRNAA